MAAIAQTSLDGKPRYGMRLIEKILDPRILKGNQRTYHRWNRNEMKTSVHPIR